MSMGSPPSSLLFSAVASLMGSILYLYLAGRLARRRTSAGARAAGYALVTFWAGIGIASLAQPFLIGLYTLNALPLWAFETATQLTVVTLVAALGSLTVYLSYLYRGDYRWWPGLAAFYVLVYLELEAFVFASPTPAYVTENGWSVAAGPAGHFPPLAVWLLVVSLLVPQLVGAAMYLRLYWRVDDRSIRYRIALVSGSILVWFGSSVVESAVSIGTGSASTVNADWQVASRLIAIGAAIGLLLAYYPPRAWQVRWGLRAAA